MICFDLGTSIDWTAVSAIATLLMTIATFVTIVYNRKQINEIQRQWREENKARLIFSIISDNGLFLLKIENIGKEVAYDTRISINNSFLDKMLIQDFKDSLLNLCDKKMYLPPKRIIYCIIHPTYSSGTTVTKHASYSCEQTNQVLDTLINEPIIITGEFSGKEKVMETLTINNSTGSIIVNSPEVKEMDKINKELKNTTKKLQDIAAQIAKAD